MSVTVTPFPIWRDEKYAFNDDVFRYHIDFNGRTVYNGRAFIRPGAYWIDVNVDRIIRDYLENDIDILATGVTQQEDAYGVFDLYNSVTGDLVAQYGCLFNFVDDWNGETMVLSEPVNGHLDPRMTMFWSKYNTGQTSESVTTEDIYTFSVVSAVTVAWNAGEAVVPVSTNYPLNQIYTVCPEGVRNVEWGRDFVFEVPINYDLENPKTYTVQWYRNGVLLGTTVITVSEMEYYFNCDSNVNVNARGGNFVIHWDTNLQPNQIDVEVPSGFTIVSKSATGVTITAPANNTDTPFTGVVTFRYDGDVIGTTNLYQAAAGEFSCDAFKLVEYTGGTVTIGVETTLDMSRVTVSMPAGWTLLSKTQTSVTINVPSIVAQGDTNFNVEFYYNGTRFLGSTQVTQRGVWLNAADTVVAPSGTTTVTIPFTTNIEDWQNITVSGNGLTLVAMSATGATVTVTGPTTAYFYYRGMLLDSCLLFETSNNYLTVRFLDDTSAYFSAYWRKKGTEDWYPRPQQGDSRTVAVSAGDEYELKRTNGSGEITVKNLDEGARVEFYGNYGSIIWGDNFSQYTNASPSFNPSNPSTAFTEVNDNVVSIDGMVMPSAVRSYASMFANKPNLKSARCIFSSVYAPYAIGMFSGCTQMQIGPALPATGLTEADCYANMFEGCSSLATAPTLPATQLTQGCYSAMFKGCSLLTTAPALPGNSWYQSGTVVQNLPASCYYSMFQNCTRLTSAPTLSAENIGNSSYAYMFAGCTSLVNAPVISAVSVNKYGCLSMFEGCTGIVTAPALPMVALETNCYEKMFKGCTSLVNPPVLSVMNVYEYCYSGMFQNCTSLVTAPTLPANDLKGIDGTYSYMFAGCTSLVNAPALPALDLEGSNAIYMAMFSGCTSLVTAPSLPAANVWDQSYEYMFQGCTSLVNAPSEIPEDAGACLYSYAYMFAGCTSLRTAPVFKPTVIEKMACKYMFSGCTSLEYIETYVDYVVTERESGYNRLSTYNWVADVPAGGTFVSKGECAWENPSPNGVPSGWTLQTA